MSQHILSLNGLYILPQDYRKARAVAGSAASCVLPLPSVDEVPEPQQSEVGEDKQESEELAVQAEIAAQEAVPVEQQLEPELQPAELVSELEPTPDLHADEILRILDSAPDVSNAVEPPELPLAAEEEYW